MARIKSPEKPQIPVTIFTCVKLRSGKKPGCSGCGARNLLDSLRLQLADAGLPGVTVQPTGCLKKCKKGPVVVLFAAADGLKKPPKKAWKKADARFKRVRPEGAIAILAAAKSLSGL